MEDKRRPGRPKGPPLSPVGGFNLDSRIVAALDAEAAEKAITKRSIIEAALRKHLRKRLAEIA